VKFDAERFPWLTVLGAAGALGLVLSDRLTALPVGLTEALVLVVLGLEVSKSYTRRKPFTPFLMVLLWLLQFLVNAASPTGFVLGVSAASVCTWGVLVAEFALAALYFSDRPALAQGDYAYAALYLVAVLAAVKLLGNLTSWTGLWGLAALAGCLGYLLPRHGYRMEWVPVLTPAGAALGLLLALSRMA